MDSYWVYPKKMWLKNKQNLQKACTLAAKNCTLAAKNCTLAAKNL